MLEGKLTDDNYIVTEKELSWLSNKFCLLSLKVYCFSLNILYITMS